MMMAVVVRMRCLRLVKMTIYASAGLVFHLNGGVFNLILMRKKVVYAAKQGVMIVRGNDLHVKRH